MFLKKAPYGSPKKVVATAAVGLALGYSVVGMATFSLYVVPLTQTFGWGRGDVSIAYTAMCYLMALGSPLVGAVMDRIGVRRVVLPSIVLFSLAYAALSLQGGDLKQYYGLYLLLAVVGVGTAPPSYARVIVLWFQRHRGLALGLGLAGVGVGTALLPLYIQYWIGRHGFRAAYLATAVLVLGVSFPLAWAYLDEPKEVGGRRDRALDPSGLSTRECLGQRVFWQMLIGFLLLGLFTSGFVAHLVPLLHDRGVGPDVAASALSLLGVTMVLGRILTGFLLDRYFAPPVVTVCILAASLGSVILLPPVASGWAYGAVILVGFTIGAELDFMSYLVSRYQGLRYFGRVYGLMYGIFILGSGIGPLIMGYAQQNTGSYRTALASLAAGTLVAAGLFASLGRYPEGSFHASRDSH